MVPSLDELCLPLSTILELITSNIVRGHLEPSSTLCYCIMRLAQSHMSECVHVYVHVCVCLSVCAYVFVYVCVVSLSVRLSVCLSVSVFVCV